MKLSLISVVPWLSVFLNHLNQPKISFDFQGLNNVMDILEKHSCVFLYSHTHNTSDTRCVKFFLSPTSSPTPAVCCIIHFSPDTIYLELVSDPTTEGLSHTSPPTSSAKTKAQVVTCTSDWPAINLVVMTPSSGSIICYNSPQNSGKLFTPYCLFITKDISNGVYSNKLLRI